MRTILKGRYHWNTRTDEGIKKAIGYFEDAIRKDSNYAAGILGIGRYVSYSL
jgi:hypothetical protein